VIDDRIAKRLIEEEGFTAEELVEFEHEIKDTLLYRLLELLVVLKDAIYSLIGKNRKEGD
jgi:hypothetical protein